MPYCMQFYPRRYEGRFIKISLLRVLLTRSLLQRKKRDELLEGAIRPCQRCSCPTRSGPSLAELEGQDPYEGLASQRKRSMNLNFCPLRFAFLVSKCVHSALFLLSHECSHIQSVILGRNWVERVQMLATTMALK